MKAYAKIQTSPPNDRNQNMSRKIYPNPIKTAALVLIACAILFTENIVGGQSNPVTGRRSVDFIRNGVHHQETIDVDGVWNPNYSGWNGKFASDGITKIANVDTSLTFPIDPISPTNPNGKNITAAEVNAFWDAHYYPADRIGEPTWDENCHGHSTGLGFWINDGLSALITVGDWVMCTSVNDVYEGCLYISGSVQDHTVKITGVEDYGIGDIRVSQTTEKMAYAGTYEKL